MPVRRKILVVDEDSEFRKDAKKILSGKGYDVSTAPNPKAYYGIVRALAEGKKNFDTVMLDLTFPGANANCVELIEYARKAGLDSLPFIILTGIQTKVDSAKLLESGVAKIVAKPINYQSLDRLLSDIIFGSEQAAAPITNKRDFIRNLDNLDMYCILFNYFDPLGLVGQLTDDEIILVHDVVNKKILEGKIAMQKTIEDVVFSGIKIHKKNIVNEHICNDRQYLDFILRNLGRDFVNRQRILDQVT